MNLPQTNIINNNYCTLPWCELITRSLFISIEFEDILLLNNDRKNNYDNKLGA